MRYDYKCTCGNTFEVVKPMADSDKEEICHKCQAVATRAYYPTRGFVKNFEAAYYPALGKVFTNRKDLNYHLDSKGLVEVGNDFGDANKMIDRFDKDRQERIDKTWENI